MDSDRPISQVGDDRFGRASLADSIAADLAAGFESDSIVAALIGPWGSGKTSVLNLVRSRLTDNQNVVVLEFNPWFFSGTEQLVQHFLADLAAQLASRTDTALQAIAARLDAYRQVLEPVAAVPVVGRVAKLGAIGSAVGSTIARKSARFGGRSIQDERRAIEAALKATDRRFVIVLDDIDRLESDEIRDIVRLVRLVADFPRTSYLLAFDRNRVEEALGRGDAGLGRDYLEKIVQVLYPLPTPSRAQLAGLAFGAVDRAIHGLPTRELDQRYWGNVSALVVQPLIRTPRDAKRYANALPSTIRAIGTEINLVDVLALEAVRVLLPDVFDELLRLSPALTYVDSGYAGGYDRLGDTREAYKVALAKLVELGGNRGEPVAHLLRWVFPGSQAFTGNTHHGPEWARTWRRERRVANAEVFAIYLSRALPEGAVSSALVDLAFTAMGDGDRFQAIVDAMPEKLLEPLLERIEDFEEEFPTDPLDAIVVIQNVLPRLRTGRRGMFDAGADMRVRRLLLRLLRRVEPETRRDEIARSAYAQLGTLSVALQFLLVVGHRENIGHGLVSAALERQLESQLRADIRSASVDELATERDLTRLLDFLREGADSDDHSRLRSILSDDGVLIALLRSSLSETLSQTVEEVTVQREAVLPWDWLEALFAPDNLTERVNRLELLDLPVDDGSADAVRTARRYADGWRPESFGPNTQSTTESQAAVVDLDVSPTQSDIDDTPRGGDQPPGDGWPPAG